MHDISSNSTPSNISDLFTYSNELHMYNTRFSAAGAFYIKYSRLHQQSQSFGSLGTKIWNSTPRDLRKLMKKAFKENMHGLLLKTLEDEDIYVDTATLIQKIANQCAP